MNKKYKMLIDTQYHIKLLKKSIAAAAIVRKKISKELAHLNDKHIIVVNNSYLAISKILELFSVT
ncbi:UDP-3-O-(3-hydroxymyristoyl)glucosamine N-acyltransferase, partial [Francisella tularensis subsp. holarctica]|nr:UDP-3-O-(3-hydroxymyristoyl)glucosamine N-acyltransferase [Francisella tularensis subsp. holarctica]